MKIRNAGTGIIWVLSLLLLLLVFPGATLAEGTVADSYNQGNVPKSNAPAGGEQPAAIPGTGTGSMIGYLVQVIFSLGFIVLLIYLLLRFLGKRQTAQVMAQLKLLAQLHLGMGRLCRL